MRAAHETPPAGPWQRTQTKPFIRPTKTSRGARVCPLRYVSLRLSSPALPPIKHSGTGQAIHHIFTPLACRTGSHVYRFQLFVRP